MRKSFSTAVAALPLALFAGLLAPTLAPAETCMSPFVKRLDRPEKYLYVFCVDADAKDHDFLAVIDVDSDSAKYGQLIYQLDLGSSGNETHHFGFTDDRTHIWGCSLFSSRLFLIDVASDPVKPELNRMVTSSFTPQNNYKKPLAQMDLKNFGKDLLVWDFRRRQVLTRLTAGLAPLECRWSLKQNANHGFTNCALDDSIWVWE